MRTGTRVIVNFADADNLDPSPGKVIGQLVRSDNGLLIKVLHDTGLENWYPESWVSPLLRTVA